MAEYRFSPGAQRDLDGIFDYSVAEWGLAQAVRYTDLVIAACAHMAEAPHQAQSCDHIRSGYRRRIIGQHIIYFRITPYGIGVIRILHQRMDTTRHL